MSGTLDASNQTADCVGTVTDAGYNLDSDGTCSLQAAAGSRSDAVADLGSLGAHGGPTPTVVPGVASAARNAIPAGQARCSATLTDQRGFPRRSPAAGNCDIGSVEATVINPRITATISSTHPKRHGWYRGVVTVRYHCATGSAAIVGGCPLATSFRSSSRDHHVTKTITAADGGSATVHVSGIKLDNRKPRVRIKGALNNHSYHSVRALHARCRDGLSGIARCRVHSHRSGNTVHYRAVARDRAGNVRYRKGHYFLV